MFGNPNHSGRFVKFANRLSKVKPLYYALGCFVFTLLVILFHHLEGFEYIFYYLYYCPIYLFLGKLFYGAFYAELFTKFLWILLLSLACYLFARSFFKSRKFSSAAISIVFLIVVIILAKYAISDIPSVVEGKYETTQATLQQVENRHQGRQGINYYISTNKRLRLNVYQYHKLEKIKRQFEDEDVNLEEVTLTVNYLPETKCVLNYEIIEK